MFRSVMTRALALAIGCDARRQVTPSVYLQRRKLTEPIDTSMPSADARKIRVPSARARESTTRTLMPDFLEQKRREIGIVIIGEHNAVTRGNPISLNHGAGGRGQHDTRPVVIGEGNGAFNRTRCRITCLARTFHRR